MIIKLLVADHQEVMRAGLRTMVARTVVKVVAEAAGERQLMHLTQKHRPQVVILDVGFAGEDGFKTLKRFKRKCPKVPVLLWSTSDNPTYIARGMALEASGYLARAVVRRELLSSIHKVVGGNNAWTSEQKRQFTGALQVPDNLDVDFSPRELEVIRQLSYGLPNLEIGLALGISYETVKEHVQHILRKLDVTDRTRAAVWAVRNGVA